MHVIQIQTIVPNTNKKMHWMAACSVKWIWQSNQRNVLTSSQSATILRVLSRLCCQHTTANLINAYKIFHVSENRYMGNVVGKSSALMVRHDTGMHIFNVHDIW